MTVHKEPTIYFTITFSQRKTEEVVYIKEKLSSYVTKQFIPTVSEHHQKQYNQYFLEYKIFVFVDSSRISFKCIVCPYSTLSEIPLNNTAIEIPGFIGNEQNLINCIVRLNNSEQIAEYESKIEVDKEIYPVCLKLKGFFFLER